MNIMWYNMSYKNRDLSKCGYNWGTLSWIQMVLCPSMETVKVKFVFKNIVLYDCEYYHSIFCQIIMGFCLFVNLIRVNLVGDKQGCV